MSMYTERGGFALPAALLALVIVGALVTGGVYAAMEEDRSSGNVQFGNHAFLAAERGLEDLLGTRNRIYFQDSVGLVGQADTIGPVAITVEGVQAQYTVFVQRLNTRLFKVDSEGEVLSGGRYVGSKRRLAEMMRITYTYVPKDRAYTTHTEVRLRGQSAINGTDVVPTGWLGCETVGVQAAVLAKDTLLVDVPPGGGNTALVGSPKMKEDAAMDSLDFVEYGDMHLDDLKEVADITLAPGTYTGMAPSSSGGVCDKTNQLNWGDPLNVTGDCHLYWPIIYSPGDLHLSTGIGQGILIVDGTLEVSGNFEFHGLVFVYGNIKATGTGNKFSGSTNVLGSNGYSELGVTGAGNTQVQLSACAIERAHMYNERFSRPIPLGDRRFIDMSGIGAT
ncbi:MAG: hypothetical protein KY466_07415 [Gemmatimonadetes bacterium]|nr:hypothetical protein [Gemmatimonadota bacterium]